MDHGLQQERLETHHPYKFTLLPAIKHHVRRWLPVNHPSFQEKFKKATGSCLRVGGHHGQPIIDIKQFTRPFSFFFFFFFPAGVYPLYFFASGYVVLLHTTVPFCDL
jgi:hypothetical protein